MINTTGATSGAGTAYPSAVHLLETLALHVDNMARRKKRLKKQKINRNRKSKEGQTIK
jgi:NADP-dependent 3-hydroxy acid dehydrogenase YdfG